MSKCLTAVGKINAEPMQEAPKPGSVLAFLSLYILVYCGFLISKIVDLSLVSVFFLVFPFSCLSLFGGAVGPVYKIPWGGGASLPCYS